MTVWQEILVAIGGNATVLIVLGFLARSLIQTWLTKDVRKFEADLKTAADSELERLKSDLKDKGDISVEQLKSHLQQAVIEHQVRFSNLHEKRATIIAEVYARAVEVHWIGRQFVLQMGSQEHEQEGVAAQNAILDFYKFFESHRIYLPERICASLATFIDALRKPVIAVYVYGGIDYPNEQTLKERKEAFMTAYQAFEKHIPAAIKALEMSFGQYLGSRMHDRRVVQHNVL